MLKKVNFIFSSLIENKKAKLNTTRLCSLGGMAANIIHEINTPISILQMKLEIFEEELQHKYLTQDEIIANVQMLRKTADRLSKTIHEMQILSRDSSSDSIEKVSLSSLLEETLGFYQEKFSHYGVEFIYDNKCSSHAEIYCRSTAISQTLINLLNNAFDACQASPQKWVRLQALEEAEWIQFNVIDSGPGIPVEIRHKIMQSFFTTKPPGQGTGLGLSISKEIIQAHHGKFFFDSNSPHTCFTVRLPKKQNVVFIDSAG